jgi:hypothetical protein
MMFLQGDPGALLGQRLALAIGEQRQLQIGGGQLGHAQTPCTTWQIRMECRYRHMVVVCVNDVTSDGGTFPCRKSGNRNDSRDQLTETGASRARIAPGRLHRQIN